MTCEGQTVYWREALFAQIGAKEGEAVAQVSGDFVKRFETKGLGPRDCGTS